MIAPARHRQDDEQVVVGHLHVVGQHLECCEECGHQQSREILPPVGQHYACDERGQICQGHHLPIVAGGNDDEEVAGEGPYHRPEHGQIPAEVECPEQDIEAQQVGEDVPHDVGQPEVVGLARLVEQLYAVVGRCQLIGWHAAEQGVGPSRPFTGALQILGCFLSGSPRGRRVVAEQDAPLDVGRKEICHGNHYKQ